MAKKPTETLKTNGQTPPEGVTAENTENKGPEFTIQRIYVKDISLETPHSPFIFQEEWRPDVDVQLNAATQKLAQDVYEVKLSITVTARLKDKVAFLAEAHQAGIFTITQLPDDQLNRMLGSYCPHVLFPFARELVSDLITRTGFPPLYLAPINFDALYEQQIANQQNKLSEEQAIKVDA
jgi:preprotein translocase subunit SecB